MEYDSASNCDGRLRDLEASVDSSCFNKVHPVDQVSSTNTTKPWNSLPVVTSQPSLKLGRTNRVWSSQVMEYYQKYSQSGKLDQYFSTATNNTPPEAVKYYYSIYEVNPGLGTNRQDCIGEEYNLKSCVPRERRRWARPPLIGQSSSGEGSSRYIRSIHDRQSPSPDLKNDISDTILEEKNESHETLPETSERKISSPTSSIASHKPLEWDSGADVGYFNTLPNNKQNNKKLSTIERMALARGCSAALRQDPEGTTESGITAKVTVTQRSTRLSVVPDANSTPLIGNASGSESEIEITPIVKNRLPGIITGSDIKSEDRTSLKKDVKQQEASPQSSKKELYQETPKSTFTFKMPHVKCGFECKNARNKQIVNKENVCVPLSPLKKSTSMNTLIIPTSKQALKRSQSELNLCVKEKNRPPVHLIYNSTSSIATVVNKPTTCDKVIQTSLCPFPQESVGVQVSVMEEEKPPLPKRGTSLHKNSQLTSKNTKGTYKVKGSKELDSDYELCNSCNVGQNKENKTKHSSSEQSQNGSDIPTPQPDDTENITGRTNSFEYFPGHIYENVPNGSGSHISSTETGSTSTLPNTSSSINDKLWGDCDSLVKDLERSVNILKRLIDANKCDKEVKKRLIHHVVRRLIVAKYTDDKIEHNLEDNVPWNPDNARSKVYRSEILQAFTKKQNGSDSSQDWSGQKKSTCTRKSLANSTDIMKEVALESSNSDKFDKNTDRTETDGRKARMSLRTDDCHRSSNTTTDQEKSGSSECFFPQRIRKTNKVQDIFSLKEQCKMRRQDSTSTSTVPDHNRMLLDAVVNRRRATVPSTNDTEENIDWRLFPTLSERQFELKKRSNSDSGESKLVTYAEMEKKNQLIWITNEISHLCNLKKLLEQSRKPERSRSSPRKSNPGNTKCKTTVLAQVHDPGREVDYLHRNVLNERANSAEDSWGSHCNGAAYRPTTSTTNSLVHRVRKRNSCAQTATNVTSAHSKTGGEIVSASYLHKNTVKLVSTGVQTLPQKPMNPIPTVIQSEIVHYIKCPAHKTVMHLQTGCKCTDKACCNKHISQSSVQNCARCAQEQNQPILNCVQKAHGNVECLPEVKSAVSQTPLNETISSSISSSDIIHQCPARDSAQCKSKELQTQISAAKSTHTCENNATHSCKCAEDSKCGANGTEEKGIECQRPLLMVCQLCSSKFSTIGSNNAAGKCEECRKDTVSYSRDIKESGSVKKCTCIHACNCASKHTDSNKHYIATREPHKYHQETNEHALTCNQNSSVKLCECSTECSCENNRETIRISCTCQKSMQHNGIHCCTHCSKKEEGINQAGHVCTNAIQIDEIVRHREVQNDLKCNCEHDASCVHKAKSVGNKAYNRLCNNKANFAPEDASTSDSERACKCCHLCGTAYQNVRKCNCRQTYPKPVAYELSFAKVNHKSTNTGAVPKVPLSNQHSSVTKINGCDCKVIKKDTLSKETIKKETLQDYLSRNKPDFVGNAETRRQYMSEICHLRQLRKEKRVQLLAMASSSNIIKEPKVVVKPTVPVQKKMTDEQIRLRLKKRYSRLNEVRFRRRQLEKEEEARRNKLMAKIFCKKLQQKVLEGQVDLSQSVSVISNL